MNPTVRAIALYNIRAATENNPPTPPKIDLMKMLRREGWKPLQQQRY